MNGVYGFSVEQIEASRMKWQEAADQGVAREPGITLSIRITEDMQEVVVDGELDDPQKHSEGHVGLAQALLAEDAVAGLFQGVISALQAHRFQRETKPGQR